MWVNLFIYLLILKRLATGWTIQGSNLVGGEGRYFPQPSRLPVGPTQPFK
jgi:hypothetical protein